MKLNMMDGIYFFSFTCYRIKHQKSGPLVPVDSENIHF